MIDPSNPPSPAAASSLPEADVELLGSLTPEMARLLYPDQSSEPFRITAVYPELPGEAGIAALRIEAAATAHSVLPQRPEARGPLHHTTFSLAQIEEFHELYHLAEASIGSSALELLLNGRRVPLARELWLPLIWTLRK